MDVYNYTQSGVKKGEIRSKNPTWVDLIDPTDSDLEKLAKELNIPIFVLERSREDFRPRLEHFEDFIFMNFKTCTLNEELETDTVHFFFSKKWLVTIHSGHSVMQTTKEKLESGIDKNLASGLDFLLYSLLMGMVEMLFPIIEALDDKVDMFEEKVFKNPDPKILEDLFNLRSNTIQLHRIVWGERELLLGLQKGVRWIKERHLVYFRDLYDDMIQLADSVETGRDMLRGAIESYLSVVSNKMNEVMKVLTVIATIMMPLTLITGIYGMNFQFMPELYWKYGYFGTLSLMVTLGVIMLFFFKRKGWV